MFGSTYYFQVTRDQRRKLNPKNDEGIFFGYSINSRAYHMFNYCTKYMMESINFIINNVQSKVITHEDQDFSILD